MSLSVKFPKVKTSAYYIAKAISVNKNGLKPLDNYEGKGYHYGLLERKRGGIAQEYRFTSARAMQKYKIADLVVGVDFQYERGYNQAQPYRIDDETEPDICLKPNDFQIKYALDHGCESPEMAEYCATRWLFDEKILHVDGLVLHSSAVVYENRAYLFSADSGTGKSTHTRLWLKRFGEDRTFILNDDAPALRKIDGTWFAYGTPWSGTSPLNVNARVPLRGIGFIERSQTNWARQISPDEAIKLFMRQTTSPLQKKTLVKTLDRIVALLEETPVFLVGCTMDPDASRVSYEALRDARSYKELGGKLN